MLDPVYLMTILTSFVLYYLYQKLTYSGPPHVTGLPVVGYLPFLGKEPYLKFHKLLEKHGPIFSLYMGSNYTVVLANYDVLHEAFVEKGNLFNGRPSYQAIKVYDYETAFALTDGEEWKVTRNFTINSLKKLGFGKNYTENFVQIEIRDLISELKQSEGRPVEISDMISKSMITLILSLLTGKRYDRSEQRGWFAQVMATTLNLTKAYSHDMAVLFPWIRKLPFPSTFRTNIRALKDMLWSLMESELKPLKSAYSKSPEPDNNFVHSWYKEQEKRNNNDDPHKQLFSDFSLKNHVDILIQAASDTTSTTLRWAFLFLVLHQDVQDKIQEEIDQHVGFSKEPTLDDAKNMHYTRAFLLEVHRRAPILPLGLFHSNKVKGNIRGFEIPKNTVIISNLWSLHHDPSRFPDPYTFDPERFLDRDRKFMPCEYLSAFSIGRRICPGKQVAEMQLFLYLTFILQEFELRLPPGASISANDCECDMSVILRPVPHEIIFTVRNKEP